MHKRLYSLSVFALLLLLAAAVPAQSPAPPQPITTIPQTNCVVHSGDSPAWAASEVDTSGWTPLSQFNPSGKDTVFWVRCATSESLATLPDPAIQVMNVYAGLVWVNGRQVGVIEFGPGSATRKSAAALTLALPADVAGSVRSIAIRCILTRAGWAHSYQPALVRLGIRESLIDHRIAEAHHFPDGLLPAYSLFLLVGASGIFLLCLSFYDRSQRPALWLALYCLPAGFFRISSYLWSLASSAPDAVLSLWSTLIAFSNWFAVLFFFSIAQRRMPRLYWIVFAAVCYFVIGTNLPLVLPARWALPMSLFMLKTLGPTQEVQSLAFIAPLVAFWPLNRLRGQRRTLFIVCLFWSMTELFYDYQGHLFHLPWTSPIQNFVALASLIVIAALVAIIFRDQRKTAEERAQLAGEMEAAREVQQQLVPASIPRVAGFQIDTAYLPAAEVGGDFYQVLLLADGATLIAVGDVSGKGLKAAMTGALAIGALRTLAAEGLSPDELLTRLNRQIVDAQNGGFITCLCLRVAADGAIRFANAGHIPPYRNGAEASVENSLPLGIAAEIHYSEAILQLHPNEQITLLTDGVIEATHPATKELFGFDRTAAISTRSAEEIAHVAQQFGQEDDITVLTLTRTAAEAQHA